MMASLVLAFVRGPVDAMFAYPFKNTKLMHSAGGLPLNDVSQLSDMYSIVENVRCFYHFDSETVLLIESV